MKSDKLIDAMNDIKDEYILEAREEKKSFSFKPFIKPMGIVMACFCLLFIFIPRNNYRTSQYESKNVDSYGLYEETYEAPAEGAMNNAAVADKKIVVNSSLSMETKDLDKVIEKLENSIQEFEGYVQSSSISTYDSIRTYYLTARIPVEQYDSFVEKAKELGNVTFYSKSQDDITDYYVDSQSRLESLKEEEKRVLKFYDEAQTIEELITVEQRLTEIQEEISYLESSIDNMDNSTTYSTISIDVTETSTFSANGDFFSRIQYAFSNGWENFVNTLTGIFEFVVYYWVFVVIILVGGLFIHFRKKK